MRFAVNFLLTHVAEHRVRTRLLNGQSQRMKFRAVLGGHGDYCGWYGRMNAFWRLRLQLPELPPGLRNCNFRKILGVSQNDRLKSFVLQPRF